MEESKLGERNLSFRAQQWYRGAVLYVAIFMSCRDNTRHVAIYYHVAAVYLHVALYWRVAVLLNACRVAASRMRACCGRFLVLLRVPYLKLLSTSYHKRTVQIT